MAAAQTRGAIIAAAADTFARHGIDRVALDEVAAEAHVHRGTLHRHFPGGREELVLAALEHRAQETQARAAAVADAAPTAADALLEASTYLTLTARDDRTVAPLLRESSARAALLGPAAAHLRAGLVDLWCRIADRAAAEGRSVTTVDPERVVDHLVRVGFSLVNEPGTVIEADDVRDHLRTFVLPALLPDPSA